MTYSNRQKTAQLGVPAMLFETVGAVSREVVEAMARGAQQRSGARFAVAVSGVAGPDGGTPDKPVGTVWLAWADGAQLFSPLLPVCRLARRGAPAIGARALHGVLRRVVGENPGEG